MSLEQSLAELGEEDPRALPAISRRYGARREALLLEGDKEAVMRLDRALGVVSSHYWSAGYRLDPQSAAAKDRGRVLDKLGLSGVERLDGVQPSEERGSDAPHKLGATDTQDLPTVTGAFGGGDNPLLVATTTLPAAWALTTVLPSLCRRAAQATVVSGRPRRPSGRHGPPHPYVWPVPVRRPSLPALQDLCHNPPGGSHASDRRSK